jgi:hypothetical protein
MPRLPAPSISWCPTCPCSANDFPMLGSRAGPFVHVSFEIRYTHGRLYRAEHGNPEPLFIQYQVGVAECR